MAFKLYVTNMYFNYSFLLSNFYTNDFVPDFPGSGSIIVPVTKSIWEEKAYFFQKLYNTSTTFCFGFFQADEEWRNAELSNVRDALSLFFFLPNYAKNEGAYLLLSDLDARSEKDVMNDLEQMLETQGITPLAKNYTIKNDNITKFNQYYYYNADLIEAFGNESPSIDFSVLFKKLVADNGASKQIVIAVKDEEDYQKKISVIKEFDQWVSNNEKAYADLLSAFKKINDQHLKLKIDNKKLHFRLDNYNDYLKAVRKIAQWHVDEYHRIHREQQATMQQYGVSPNNITNLPLIYSSDEALQKELEYLRSNRDEIRRWYEKEYEVLPLWYKRFGHIVKVMMGRRSLKSLYK